MREWDSVESLVSEAINLLMGNKGAESLLKLVEARGICQVYVTQENVWDIAREDYEAGLTPKRISLKLGLTLGHIYDRAYNQAWINPRKIKDALKKDRKASKRGNTFILDCVICEQKFQSATGSCKTCDQCRARKAMEGFGQKVYTNDFFC